MYKQNASLRNLIIQTHYMDCKVTCIVYTCSLENIASKLYFVGSL